MKFDHQWKGTKHRLVLQFAPPEWRVGPWVEVTQLSYVVVSKDTTYVLLPANEVNLGLRVAPEYSVVLVQRVIAEPAKDVT